MSSELTAAIKNAFPQESYLTRWVEHHNKLTPLPQDFENRWSGRVVQHYRTWLDKIGARKDVLTKQEDFLLLQGFDTSLRLETLNFLNAIYPELSQMWAHHFSDPVVNEKRIRELWSVCRTQRLRKERDLKLSQELPAFHSQVINRLQGAQKAEQALASHLTKKDVGWDLENGFWENLNWEGLLQFSTMLENEPQIQKIAELMGRDWRSKHIPPAPPRQLHKTGELEPGKEQIQGINWGKSWENALPGELVLLADAETQGLFFLKEAEGRLLSWDYQTQIPPPEAILKSSSRHLNKNLRGPMVAILDTSGSMRGKPELVAKATVLALARIAFQENRAFYLINFSSEVKTFDVTDLKQGLKPFLEFLQFSFHGGTDLPPALREGLRILQTQNYKEADVLILSDFATPKVPGPLRDKIRQQREELGSRFYSLTISTRPLNDFLNLFDASWVYDIHPGHVNGIQTNLSGEAFFS